MKVAPGGDIRRLCDETGAVAVIVAILLIVLMAFGALVVDAGYWYNEKRQLQAAADAAALAGCWDLINGQDNATISDTVDEYAGYNTKADSDASGSPVALVLWQDPWTQIGADYVKVTVRKEAPSFLAALFGGVDGYIHAQAKAQAQYVTGTTPVPWGLPIMAVSKATAQIGAHVVDLEQQDGKWVGYLPIGASGDVSIHLHNSQTYDSADGVEEVLDDVAYVTTRPTDARIVGVDFDDAVFTSGVGTGRALISLASPGLAAGERLELSVAGDTHEATKISDTLYEAHFPAPSTASLWQSFGVKVEIKQGGKKTETFEPAGYVSARRSTHPVLDVSVTPTVYESGSSGAPLVQVQMNDYVYGKEYELKVSGGGAESGNFMAIDFSTTRHQPNWEKTDPVEYPDFPGSSGGSSYYDWLEGSVDYDFVMHVGDTVWTESGNMSKTQTVGSLSTRFDGDNRDFDAWEADLCPPSRRIVYVPVTEKIQQTTGMSPLRVLMFAAFYVQPETETRTDGTVIGCFIKYSMSPGSTSPTSPGTLSGRAPVLVGDVDF